MFARRRVNEHHSANARLPLFIVLVGLCATGRTQQVDETDHPPAEGIAPVRLGEAAPDWRITEWSDGQNHSISDFRGKVIVLDFWGIWCGPCYELIPVLQELEEEYAQQGVVFLAIHTAGTDLKDVTEILRREQWSIPTGLDSGNGISSGVTARRYGVIGYPTVVVIGRDGVMLYNSSVDALPAHRDNTLREYEKIAKSLDIPWPITFEGDRDTDEVRKDLRLLAKSLYQRKIDAAITAMASAASDDACSEMVCPNTGRPDATEP